jgi:short-subunit dehydrogenase
MRSHFHARYGPWALVAGGSSGIGAEYARSAARRGLNVVLVARREPELQKLAAELSQRIGVAVRTVQLDLARPDVATALESSVRDLEIGLLVYNAGRSLIGGLLDHSLDEHFAEIDLNCRGPLALAYQLGSRMAQRRRGGIVLMTSLAGYQGSPWIANYAATRAYNLVLAEGLWAEFKPLGVDVLACCAGATATPGYASAAHGRTSSFVPAPLSPRQVAEEALDALGRTPSFVPGRGYRLVSRIVRHLPRRVAIDLMERNTRTLRPEQHG